MSVKLEVGKFYESNYGEVFRCTDMEGDDPLRVDEHGYGPFVLNGCLYHQDGRFGDQKDLDGSLSIKQEVTEEGKQMEDEWSDWIEDRDEWISLGGMDYIVEHKDGMYFRHKKKLPDRTIEVGKYYPDHKGNIWECILVEDDIAYMRISKGAPAYRFTVKGENICQGGGYYNIDWSKS